MYVLSMHYVWNALTLSLAMLPELWSRSYSEFELGLELGLGLGGFSPNMCRSIARLDYTLSLSFSVACIPVVPCSMHPCRSP